ncbi:hypothetical protein EG344_21555 [Chryseobacterium sp. G0162]|nr:hypothetical protein EG344_21555 [Chryseobacterium sp. G0162]
MEAGGWKREVVFVPVQPFSFLIYYFVFYQAGSRKLGDGRYAFPNSDFCLLFNYSIFGLIKK